MGYIREQRGDVLVFSLEAPLDPENVPAGWFTTVHGTRALLCVSAAALAYYNNDVMSGGRCSAVAYYAHVSRPREVVIDMQIYEEPVVVELRLECQDEWNQVSSRVVVFSASGRLVGDLTFTYWGVQ